MGAAVSAIFGGGLAIALGIDFVWGAVVLAVDDSDIDDQVQESVRRPEERPSASSAAGRSLTGSELRRPHGVVGEPTRDHGPASDGSSVREPVSMSRMD